jgi:hypothetical protein
MYSVVHVYVLGLTLRASVNDFYKKNYTLDKCKRLNLTIVSVYGVTCKCRLV